MAHTGYIYIYSYHICLWSILIKIILIVRILYCTGVLDLLLKNGKPVYVFFGMDTQEIWAQILGCDGSDGLTAAYKDMEGLKTYMEAHPGIVGLVLKQLEFDVSFY